MFKTYKPKGDRVKAVQLTAETAKEIADTFRGRVVMSSEFEGASLLAVEWPTFDGLVRVQPNDWVLEDGQLMRDEAFQNAYEPARVTKGE